MLVKRGREYGTMVTACHKKRKAKKVALNSVPQQRIGDRHVFNVAFANARLELNT